LQHYLNRGDTVKDLKGDDKTWDEAFTDYSSPHVKLVDENSLIYVMNAMMPGDDILHF